MYLHNKMTRLLCYLALSAAAASAQVKIVAPDGDAGRIHVEIHGKPYADFVVKSDEAMKPYLYPLRAASGTIVTRHWPMEKVSAVEPADHQHQRGVWFGPDDVNGFDFWNNETSYKTTIRGAIKLNKIVALKSGKKKGSIAATFDWLDPQGAKIVEQLEVITFHDSPTLRIVDFAIDLTAVTHVKFGDGKDCCFGIRISPQLQESKVVKTKGQPDVTIPGTPGVIANSDGKTTEKEVWGKPANWADYSGEIDGEKLGIAIFDNPKNSRRARWHERGYGLFAANPFGFGAFTGDKSQDGSVTLEPGQKLHFKYRVVIHPGGTDIAKLWAEYVK
jgi:Methane oxygenase PmoA